jgi:hypothetical protein
MPNAIAPKIQICRSKEQSFFGLCMDKDRQLTTNLIKINKGVLKVKNEDLFSQLHDALFDAYILLRNVLQGFLLLVAQSLGATSWSN